MSSEAAERRVTSPQGGPSGLKVWVLAARLPTLTAAIAPVAVGTGVAVHDGRFSLWPALAALLGALAIQIGANLANDVSDFRRGADTAERIGPPRVTQLGLLSQRQVLTAMWVTFAVATLAGVYLTAVAGWPVIAAGVGSILAAIAYTGGPWPFGYRGLGEVFTFVFFGLVAVGGTYYVQAEILTFEVLAAAVPVGFTVSAILIVNNIRDIETDAVAGKRTLAVMLGRRLSRWQFSATLALAWIVAVALWPIGFGPQALLALLALPLAIGPLRAVLRSEDGPTLNTALRATARLHLAFGLLIAVGAAL